MIIRKIEEIRVNSYIREELTKVMKRKNRGLSSLFEESLNLLDKYEDGLFYSKKLKGFNMSTTVTLSMEATVLLEKLRSKYPEYSKTDIVCNSLFLVLKKYGDKEQLFRVETRLFGDNNRREKTDKRIEKNS